MEEENLVPNNGRRKGNAKKAGPAEPDSADVGYDPAAALPHDSLISQYAVVKRKRDVEASRGASVTVTIRQTHKQVKNWFASVCGNYHPQTGSPGNSYDVDTLLFARPLMRILVSCEPKIENQEEDIFEELEDPVARAEAALDQIFRTRLEQFSNQYRAGVGGGNANMTFMTEFIKWADEEAKYLGYDAKAESLRSKQMVQFMYLCDILKPGQFVATSVADFGPTVFGARVLASHFIQTKSIEKITRYLTVVLECVIATASGYSIVRSQHMMQEYWDAIPIKDLSIRPLDAEMTRILSERGRKYTKIAKNAKYMQYAPGSFFFKMRPVRSGGRLMIDTALSIKTQQGVPCGPNPWSGPIRVLFQGEAQLIGAVDPHLAAANPNYNSLFGAQSYALQAAFMPRQNVGNPDSLGDSLPNPLLPLVWPALPAFSFAVKDWGYVLIDGISDIQFNEKAFDQLVLEQERKDLIAAIVSHSQVVFRDIISGKGGGSIFLLHGPPGVGKTLTAEAAAEMLHKPLYPVSMAELGTTPAELEAGLTKILELASEWGAIVLMDEADIFLERRSQNEIVRNAMVGVLLRQLEYYPGVLFLTSNRVDVFDEALHSRITVALRYEELSETIRAQVWTSLLSAAGLALADHVNELATFVLNGRQIKNAIALAQGLARSSGSDVTIQHLLRTINVILQFKSDLMKK